MKTLLEKLNNTQKSYLAPLTYLIWKLYQDNKNQKDLEYMLDRVDEDLFDALKEFLSEDKFEHIPELLGDEEPSVYLKYFKDITEEEINNIIR